MELIVAGPAAVLVVAEKFVAGLATKHVPVPASLEVIHIGPAPKVVDAIQKHVFTRVPIKVIVPLARCKNVVSFVTVEIGPGSTAVRVVPVVSVHSVHESLGPVFEVSEEESDRSNPGSPRVAHVEGVVAAAAEHEVVAVAANQ